MVLASIPVQQRLRRRLYVEAVRGDRVSERRLADERVAVILRDRAAAGVASFTPHDMRQTYL